MKDNLAKPEFRLRRVLQDSSGVPRVFAVEGSVATGLDRRKFLNLGLGVPAAMALGTFWAERAAADTLIAAHKGAVFFLAMSPDASVFLSLGEDRFKKWTLPDGKLLDFHFGLGNPRGGGKYLSPSGTKFASVTDDTLWLYSFQSGKLLGSCPISNNSTVVAISPDDRWAAITDSTGINLCIIPKQEGFRALNVERTIERHSERVSQLSIHGSLLISGSRDGRVCAWSFPDGAVRSRLETGADMTSMQILGEPLAVVTGHRDGTILVTSLPDGKAVAAIKARSSIDTLAPGPGAGRITSLTIDGSIDVWSAGTGERLDGTSLSRLGLGTTTALTTSGNASWIAAGLSSGQIVLLDWPSLSIKTHLFDPNASPVGSKAVSFKMVDQSTGRTITYTLPCGSGIPAGATCICNCVPGTATVPNPNPPSTTIAHPPPPQTYSYPSASPVPGATIRQPCTAAPVPPGYTCTCNCIPGR